MEGEAHSAGALLLLALCGSGSGVCWEETHRRLA
jgi:hypothetical protein